MQPEQTGKKRVFLYVISEDSTYYKSPGFIDQQLTMMGFINNTIGWEYGGLYVEVSGEHTAMATMISDCRSGKIDVIVTNSMLRFGKSLKDSLEIAEMLKALDPPVEIIFTDEAIFTSDDEMMEKLSELIRSPRQAAGIIKSETIKKMMFADRASDMTGEAVNHK